MHPPRDSGGFRRLPDTVARAMSPLPAITKLVLTRLRWVFATGDQRDAEILALRHQLLVLQRQIDRAQFTETDRTILTPAGTSWITGVVFHDRDRNSAIDGGETPLAGVMLELRDGTNALVGTTLTGEIGRAHV